jgi:hypothetical protein
MPLHECPEGHVLAYALKAFPPSIGSRNSFFSKELGHTVLLLPDKTKLIKL